jgi:hypothetical protein
MSKSGWSKKRAILAIAIIVILTGSSFGFWQMNNNAQAAIVSPNPPSDLVGWWRFDEGTGSVASDSSENENTGTISGATWVDGKYGGALSFNGVNNYVNCGSASSLDLNQAVTVEAWVNPASTNSYQAIVDKGWDAAYTLMVTNVGTFRFQIRDATGTYRANSPPLTVGVWTHVVGTYNATTKSVKIYVNGVLQSSAEAQGAILSTAYPLNIGKAAQYGPAFNGIIDEVRIYNRALSAAEIQTNFGAGPGFASQLTAKIPKGTTQVIATLSWQGDGSINATITSPSQTYTEETMQTYQKTTYSTTSSTPNMLNIKRLSIPVTALTADESWTIELAFDSVTDYQIAVEVQK